MVVKIPVAGMIEVTKVKTHPNNVKKHPKEQINNLMQLMKWVGFKDPIVLDKDNNLKAGHGRLIAADKLGMTEVPYIRLEGLTKKQMDLFIYMDNQINESPWIKENVELLLEEIPMKDLELFELDWDGVRKPKYTEETDEVPLPHKTPKTKLGDIYQLGNHRIMCGDSSKDVEHLMDGVKADLIFSDPPYNVDYKADENWRYSKKTNIKERNLRTLGTVKNDKMDDEEFDKMLSQVFKNLDKITTKNANYYICFGWSTIEQIKKHFETYNHLSSLIVWVKDQSILSIKNYRARHEFILYGWKLKSKHYWCGIKNEEDVWNVSRGNKNAYLHPTQKPIELPRRAIQNSSQKNNIVLDPFCGSGSTLIACEQTGRTCYGMELDPAYVDVIIERWQNFTGKEAKLLLVNPQV